jgi:hypothetical protein
MAVKPLIDPVITVTHLTGASRVAVALADTLGQSEVEVWGQNRQNLLRGFALTAFALFHPPYVIPEGRFIPMLYEHWA